MAASRFPGPTVGSEGLLCGRIVALTKKLVGKPINPHLLRDCAATTLAVNASEIVSVALPLLGHRQAATTERYYSHVKQLESGLCFRNMLEVLKSKARDDQDLNRKD